MNPTDPKPLGLVVCMPTRGVVSIETTLCLRHHLDGYASKPLTVFRKDVVTARNELAKQARELDPEKLDFDPRVASSPMTISGGLPGISAGV
jgi:hypothetical protein